MAQVFEILCCPEEYAPKGKRVLLENRPEARSSLGAAEDVVQDLRGKETWLICALGKCVCVCVEARAQFCLGWFKTQRMPNNLECSAAQRSEHAVRNEEMTVVAMLWRPRPKQSRLTSWLSGDVGSYPLEP